MVVGINESGSLGVIINYFTQNVSGSFFLTLLLIVFGLMILAFMFRIPLEFTAILIYPILIVSTAFYGEFFKVLGLFIIYTSIILAKNYIIR